MSSSNESGCAGCLNRVPYGSLLALVICWVGVGLFTAMMYMGVNSSINQAKDIFEISMPWSDKVQLTFIVLGTVMGFVALILLIVGTLATGETRRSVYKGWTARLGGRISSAIFLILTYLLYLCWLAIFSITVCLFFVYLVLNKLCQSARSGGVDCLDFHSFAGLLNGTSLHGDPAVAKICGRSMTKFCLMSAEAFPQYGMAYIGCTLLLLSLLHFMICLSANYAHIKDEIKYIELNEIHAEYRLDERM